MTKKSFIPVSEPSIGKHELELVTDCIKSGWVSSLGKYIPIFEKKFAAYCGCTQGVSVFNGTVALHLALAAIGIGPGDEVIVPTLTFVATCNSVLYTGATPVFVDSEATTWNMDPVDIERKITSRTKAIIVVHLYGHPANMGEIIAIAKKHNLRIIEDAAESHGAMYQGKRVGRLGDVGCFSFYGNKIITTGEGGMIVTDNARLAKKMHFLKDHAMSGKRRYYHPVMGFNYRITNLQAAIGVAQMEKIDSFIQRKREIAGLYSLHLQNVKGVVLQQQAPWATAVYWMFSILVTPAAGITRNKLAAALKKQGIDSRPFFIPNHCMPYFAPAIRNQSFPVAERLSKQGMNLPSSVLLTNDQVVRIATTIKSIIIQSK